MGNSIYLGGGLKSAFCGGNVKEIWQGANKLWGGEEPAPIVDEDIVVLFDGVSIYGLQPTRTTNPTIYYDENGPLNVGGTGWSGTPYVKINSLDNDGIRWQYDDIVNVINSKNFTIECWAKYTDITSSETPLFSYSKNGSSYWDATPSVSFQKVTLWRHDSHYITDYFKDLKKWNHFAIVCANRIKLFVNGDLIKETTTGDFKKDCYMNLFNIQRGDADVAQCCLTKRAKWTENFTPPTKPYILGV